MRRNRILLAATLAALIASIVAVTHLTTVSGSVTRAASVTTPSGFTITSPAANALVPCGEPVTVTWTGGDPSAVVNLLLIDEQANQVYQGFGGEPNTGTRVVTIGPGSCGRRSLFYVEDVPRTTWTYGPVFDVMCAQTFNIADGDVTGLIAAINSANANTCPTTINLASNGMYTLTSVADHGDSNYYQHGGAVGLPYIRNSLTLNGNGATIQRSDATGTPDFAVLGVLGIGSAPANLILNSTTLSGGSLGGLDIRYGTGLVQNSTITHNNGAGINNICGTLNLTNSTVSYNNSDNAYGGGGIFLWKFACPPDKPVANISFSTIFENQNTSGTTQFGDPYGPGYEISEAFGNPGDVIIKNSILASPTRAFYPGSACYGIAPISGGHNIAGDSSCGLTGPDDMANTNPLLGALANNGGPTPTHFPLCNSPAIDAVPVGDSTDTNGTSITTDQRGVARPQGLASDIGAVEVARGLTVTIPSTAGPWSQSLNPSFDYGAAVHDNTAPIVIDAASGITFTPGNTVIVTYLSGGVQAGGGYPFNDADGLPGYVRNYCENFGCFPAYFMNPNAGLLAMSLVGTFANNGVIVGNPFWIGNGPKTLTIPTGANQLLLGINDTRFADNGGSLIIGINDSCGASQPTPTPTPTPTATPTPTPTATPTPTPTPSVCVPNVFNIADGDVADLIAAINSANASDCPTTINLAPNGTYTLTGVADDGSTVYCCGPTGLPFVNSTLTINGNGATIQRSNAAGTPPFGIIRVAEPPSNPNSTVGNLTLDGVTLTGATGSVVVVWGGSTAIIRNTTITKNEGQGILTWGGNLTVLNSTISYNNGSNGYGGGGILHIGDGTTAISFSTIFENQSGGVGDAIATAFADPGRVVVKNSILASPTRGAGMLCWVNGQDAILSLGHNIAGDSTCGPGSNADPGGLAGPGDMNNTNPLLGPLANNGGPTPTHLPLCDSPAIDAVPGADSTDVNGVPITTDQRGVSRPQGAAADIGAAEVGQSQKVTIPGSAGPWRTDVNPAFDFGRHDNTAPVVVDATSGIAFAPGSSLVVTASGTALGDPNVCPNGCLTPNGDSTCLTNGQENANGRDPGFYMNLPAYCGELVGTFADHNGVIVGLPFPLGIGPVTLTVPAGANQLQLGINDNRYDDNIGFFTVTIRPASPAGLTVTAPDDSSASADASCQAAVPNYIAATTTSGASGSAALSQNPASGTLVGLGPHTVTVTAVDNCGHSSSDTVVFTVIDTTPPSVTSPSPNISANTDPGSCSAVVTFTLPAATDSCSNANVTSNPASGSSFPKGTTTVTVTATDAAGNSTSGQFTVTVTDRQNPVISCPANISLVDNSPGSCGATFTPAAPSASDNCGVASVTGTRSDGHALTDIYPVGSTTINWVATDTSGNTASCPQTISVSNPTPNASIAGPPSGALYVVNAPISFSASFSDNDGDSHTAVWTFDGAPQAGVVNETGHTVSASHAFANAGVYAVTLSLTDDCGQTATTNQVGGFDALVVVYDPSAGFVTGGGWINSPLGAYTLNPALVGKANFGFVSKYQKGANVPDGQTEFQFKAGNLNFHSTSYDWLVVAGARAQYKGSGTINGAGDYAFMLTAIDGQINGGGGVDKFRIKIWDKTSGGVIYDNQLNAPDGADPSTAIGGGSIVIQK